MARAASNDKTDTHSFEGQGEKVAFYFRGYALEDYVALLVFWALCADVFIQFFSRYVMGSSLGWTEEMARYLLIALTFLGSALAVRRHSHIYVEYFFQRFTMPAQKIIQGLVDLGRCLFFGVLTYLAFQMATRTQSMMASMDYPKSIIYYAASAGLLLMTLRSVQIIAARWISSSSLSR
ncbi:hypothetical protein BTW10_02535 [Chromohalobacter japonicus]|uniref:TRAP transporter small permease protein n=1 Tax=Chromohalobacter japonicus TaxID=223900 RepID=A0A1Q8TFB0_9GAMM|nr:TRAP transporter small permease [Chromohalobacter japonicus]OLO12375.1 hypothetical protein BTW10_02535 [Chromohalobacter japonicus]